jgi:hypothetical protein
MFRSSRRIALLVGLILAAAVGAADKDDKKKDDKKKDDTIIAGQVTGQVAHVESAGKGFRINVQVPVPDPAAMLSVANLQRQLAMTTTPQDRFNVMRQIAVQQQNMTRMEMRPLDLEPAEGMIVRLKNPPVAVDDNGKVKRYTQKELKELKGDDPKLPGFQADFDSIRMGQIVQVTLTRKKPEKPEKPEGKKPVKKEDMEFLNEERPLVKMVLIVAEPPPQ